MPGQKHTIERFCGTSSLVVGMPRHECNPLLPIKEVQLAAIGAQHFTAELQDCFWQRPFTQPGQQLSGYIQTRLLTDNLIF